VKPADVARAVLPPGVKHALRSGLRAYGTATGPARVLPDFLIIGAQKSATTSLYAYLLAHPEIAGPSSKEVDYFQNTDVRTERWYRGHFPWAVQRRLAQLRGGRLLAGEASPNYIFRPDAPAHVAALVPEAKLIALLRHPVDRALSHYNHERIFGREPLSFEEAIAAEAAETPAPGERQRRSYRARGLYAEQLEHWLACFPPEQIHVIATEELDADTDGHYREVLAFLGVRPLSLPRYEHKLAREYSGMADEIRAELEAFYAAPNERLFTLIGRRLWGA
jgi:hypothetical protein